MPSSQNGEAVLRVTTNEVLVPTLVEKRGGGILYGLKQSDFVLEDNGVPQKIYVQEELDTAPVALVVAVEEGGASVLEFGKLAKLRAIARSLPVRSAQSSCADGLRLTPTPHS